MLLVLKAHLLLALYLLLLPSSCSVKASRYLDMFVTVKPPIRLVRHASLAQASATREAYLVRNASTGSLADADAVEILMMQDPQGTILKTR